MISPPVCPNKKCKKYMKFELVIKIVNSKNKYLCKECNQEFKWSMPRAPKGAIL